MEGEEEAYEGNITARVQGDLEIKEELIIQALEKLNFVSTQVYRVQINKQTKKKKNLTISNLVYHAYYNLSEMGHEKDLNFMARQGIKPAIKITNI